MQAKIAYNELLTLAIRDYARNKSSRPHMASFCATGNNRFSLTGDSGNRCWLPFYVNHINDPFRAILSYAGLYAQAVSICRSGSRCWFADAEVREFNNCNKVFEEPIIEEKLTCQDLRTPNKDEKGSFMSVAEIRKRIGTILKYNLSKSKINRAMDKLEYVSARNTFFRSFIVIVPLPSKITDNKNDKSIKKTKNSVNFYSKKLKGDKVTKNNVFS